MSDYQHNLLGARTAPTKNEKVVPNLGDKRRYVLHYRNLQLCMSLDTPLKKIHRPSALTRAATSSPTEFRKKAIWNFQKDLLKLMNISVFGKTIENLPKLVDVKLVCAGKHV